MPVREEIVVVAGARTPFGAFGGGLRARSATDLAVAAAQGALERSGVPPERIDEVIIGNVIQSSADAAYLARHVGLRAGLPVETPALTVNRLCGSGLQAMLGAAESLLLGRSHYVLAGGTESMSNAPHVIRGARWGLELGAGRLEDVLWEAMTDSYNRMPMAITAENLALRYGISRAESDDFALSSQARALEAAANGYFAQEMIPVDGVARDEAPRAGLTRERLGQLPPRFKADGIVTPATASAITDGAAAVVMTTRAQAEADALPWLGRLAGWSVVGVDPDVMGIGPAFAIPKALANAEVGLRELAVIEINEAFAPQVLACAKELALGEARLNPHGGAIALGHPLGASGARLALTTLHDLRERGGGYGVASACIGGGQGIAAVFVVA